MRIGILGAAKIAPAAIIEPAGILPDVEVRCVGARSLARAEAFSSAHGIPSAVEGYEAVVAAPDIDLIYNALPIALHAEWTIKAASAGKHVLVEKSFAMTSAEAESMIAAGHRHNVRIIEAFHHRYHPAFETFLELVRSGEIGAVESLDAEFSVAIPARPGEIRHEPALGGGAMRDLGCYPLNWAMDVIESDIETVALEANLTAAGVDETVAADLTFASGVRASIRTSMAAEKNRVRHMQVTGSAGTLEFDNPLAPHDGSTIRLNGAIHEAYGAATGTTYFHQLKAVQAAIATGSPLPTEGDAILRQQAALDRICQLALATGNGR